MASIKDFLFWTEIYEADGVTVRGFNVRAEAHAYGHFRMTVRKPGTDRTRQWDLSVDAPFEHDFNLPPPNRYTDADDDIDVEFQWSTKPFDN